MTWTHSAVIREPEHFNAAEVVESVSSHHWLNSVEFGQVPAAVAAAKALMVGAGPFTVSISGTDQPGRSAVTVQVTTAAPSAPAVNAPAESQGAEAVSLPAEEAPAAGAEPVSVGPPAPEAAPEPPVVQ